MSGAERQRRYSARRQPIKPDRQDIEAIEREYGPLSEKASLKQQAERYRLWQAAKLIRLYEHGKLPLAQMREMDKIRRNPPKQ